MESKHVRQINVRGYREILITPKIDGSCCIRLRTTGQHSEERLFGEPLLGVFFWLSYSRSREIWTWDTYGCKCKVVVLRLAGEQAFGRGGVPRDFFDPCSKQRACSQAILQSKPIAFLTFLLPSPSSLCKLPNTHPTGSVNLAKLPFRANPSDPCVQ